MRSIDEYVPCSCGHYARIERAEDKQHRDRIVCHYCGHVTVADNIPAGVHLEIKESKDNDNND